MDKVSKAQRSANMAAVRNKNTQPEIIVCRALRRAGFRIKTHVKNLPGCPDIVLSRYRLAVFVHGCFWHGHKCKRGRRPKSNKQFWNKKIDINIRRDRKAARQLNSIGWKVRTIWGCSLVSGTRRIIKELTHIQ